MTCSKFIPVVIAVVVCVSLPATASAQRRGGGARGGAVYGGGVVRGGGGHVVAGGHAVARPFVGRVFVAPRIISPRIIGFAPYYGYPYPYYYGGYPAYGYAYPGYGYPPAPYVSAQPGYTYGGVHIEGAPQDAQVFADGYYVGVVDDFDGPFQHLNLPSGPHRIEIRMPDAQRIAVDADIFVPQRRMRGNEIRHHPDAPFVLHDLDAHAARSQQIFFTHERAVLADDDAADAVQEDRARAHRAWRQRGVHDRLA